MSSHPSAPWHDDLRQRLRQRSTVSAELRLPAVPAMLADYVELCLDSFAVIGVQFDAHEETALCTVLAEQLEQAFAASPRSTLVITYHKPIGQALTYHIKAEWELLADCYDAWVESRDPPLFGSAADARVMALSAQVKDPSACPVLDLGAGTGRHAIALARRGHPVDAVELSPAFAAQLRQEANIQGLAIQVIEQDLLLETSTGRPDYGLVVVSEVVSDFRSAAQLRQMFERASRCLRVDGRLVLNLFAPKAGFRPDAAARQLGQQLYTALFSYAEISAALKDLPLQLESDDPAYAYERQHQRDADWPPTSWYSSWARGMDLFGLLSHQSPVELRWLVYRKLPD